MTSKIQNPNSPFKLSDLQLQVANALVNYPDLNSIEIAKELGLKVNTVRDATRQCRIKSGTKTREAFMKKFTKHSTPLPVDVVAKGVLKESVNKVKYLEQQLREEKDKTTVLTTTVNNKIQTISKLETDLRSWKGRAKRAEKFGEHNRDGLCDLCKDAIKETFK